jgi:hypothetical protein
MARQGVVMSTTVDDLEFTQFWRNFKETGDLELRNELVLKYNWLVKSIPRFSARGARQHGGASIRPRLQNPAGKRARRRFGGRHTGRGKAVVWPSKRNHRHETGRPYPARD